MTVGLLTGTGRVWEDRRGNTLTFSNLPGLRSAVPKTFGSENAVTCNR